MPRRSPVSLLWAATPRRPRSPPPSPTWQAPTADTSAERCSRSTVDLPPDTQSPCGSPQRPQRRYVIPGHCPDEPRQLRAEREKGVVSGARGDIRFELVQDRARGLQVGECLAGQDDQAPPAA